MINMGLNKIIIGLLVVSALAFALGAHAQSPGQDLSIQRVMSILVGLACWMTRIGVIICIIGIAFYGIMFLTAQGSPEAYGKAKQGLTWGIVGVLVIFGTYTIIASVAVFVGSAGSGGVNPNTILGPIYSCS
jgi:hypothetical protein